MQVAEIRNFQSQEHFRELVKVCKDISARDATFKYHVHFRGDVMRLFILAEDSTSVSEAQDKLHKRGTWLIHKADTQKKLAYHVMSAYSIEKAKKAGALP